jgi:hypothetical protein
MHNTQEITEETPLIQNHPDDSDILCSGPVSCKIKCLKGVLWTSFLLSMAYGLWGFSEMFIKKNDNISFSNDFEKYCIGMTSTLMHAFMLTTIHTMK